MFTPLGSGLVSTNSLVAAKCSSVHLLLAKCINSLWVCHCQRKGSLPLIKMLNIHVFNIKIWIGAALKNDSRFDHN